MRILSFYTTKTFKLIMEFDNQEYRLLDMKELLHDEQGLLKDLCNDINLFLTAELDQVSGSIRWKNDVDFESSLLYEESQDLDEMLIKNRRLPNPRNPRKITRVPEDFQSNISKENERLIKFLKENK
ncbi:DUF2442 domain-containing protein [Cytobacillus sp. FJAT-53684]|uniref:DUF2442 domain-containing protein n=1 Tax=Cytobacillus mangrovibacter TaxID=3299024 RepID=A0ABW6K3U9_9BACI